MKMILCVDNTGNYPSNNESILDHVRYSEFLYKSTEHSICVMDEITYNSMPKELLTSDDRRFCIITENYEDTSDVSKARNLTMVIDKFKNDNSPMVILGGFNLFNETLTYNPIIYMGILKKYESNFTNQFPLSCLNDGNYKIIDGIEEDDIWMITYKSE